MAFTETEVFMDAIGNRTFGCYLLEADGSDTTFKAPVGQIDAAWMQTRTAAATGSLSWSGNTITFTSAYDDGDYLYIFFVGTP